MCRHAMLWAIPPSPQSKINCMMLGCNLGRTSDHIRSLPFPISKEIDTDSFSAYICKGWMENAVLCKQSTLTITKGTNT